MKTKSGVALLLVLLAAGVLLVGAVGCDDDDFEDFFDEFDDFLDDWHDHDWYDDCDRSCGCGHCGGGWYVVDEFWWW